LESLIFTADRYAAGEGVRINNFKLLSTIMSVHRYDAAS